MKKLVAIIMSIMLTISQTTLFVFAEEKEYFNVLSTRKIIVDNIEYTVCVLDVNGEELTTYLCENSISTFDDSGELVGYYEFPKVEIIEYDMPASSEFRKILDYRYRYKLNGPPTMYNNWSAWSPVTNSYLALNLANFLSVSALAASMFTIETGRNIKTTLATWYSLAASFAGFLGTATTVTAELYRRVNTSCSIVVKESALPDEDQRNNNYNVVWLDSPWTYDIYPYACRYLWDKDL